MVGKTNVKELWAQVKQYPNVIGYAPVLKPRIRSGYERRGGWYFRVFVSKKYGEDELEVEDILPESINNIPVDVVEFRQFFKDEIIIHGEFTLIDDAYIGTSLFF